MSKLIPIIATRNTDEVQQAITTGRPLLGASAIDPTVYENEGATAEKAKYLLAFKAKGEVSPEEVAALAAAKSSLTEIDVRMVLNAMYEVITDALDNFGGSVKMFGPFGVFETMVRGSVENATDPIDPEKHYAYLNMTPNDAMREAVKYLTFFNASEKDAPYQVGVVAKHGTNEGDPFQMGTDIDIHGRGFDSGATVKFVDCVSGEEVSATVKETLCNVIVATVPTGLDTERKYRIVVNQTIGGTDYSVGANKQGYKVAPSPLPDHEIGLVKHGSRADNSVAFDEGQTPVVVNVTHNNGATHLLRDETPKVWITIDFMDGSRHKVGTLDGLYDITVAENTITFKMTDNTTELIDGDWWNRDVTLYIGWADGTVSEKTVHFLQM